MSSWRAAGLKVKTCMRRSMNVEKAKEVCQDRVQWRSMISVYPSGTWAYVNYSNIAARVLRKCLKSEFREEAAKRDVSGVRIFYWQDGHILPPNEKPAAIQDKS